MLIDYDSAATQTLKVIICTPRRASFLQKFREVLYFETRMSKIRAGGAGG